MGPWQKGDSPQEGKVHLDICVVGKQYEPLKDADGQEFVFDASVDLDKDIPEPKARGELTVYGERASTAHDGHCPYVRWQISRRYNPE